jgi:hypothetical protein
MDLPDNARLVYNLLDEAAVLADDLAHEIPGNLVGGLRVLQHEPRLSHRLLALTHHLRHKEIDRYGTGL